MSNRSLFQNLYILNSKRSLRLPLLLLALPVSLYHSMATKDYWTILFISCLALYLPILWAACGLYLCYKTYSHFKNRHLVARENAQSSIINSLQMNLLQKLTDEIEANPEILYCDYQRRSLIAWCRYYKNTNAQELIMQMMKKYPKDKMAA